jgi:hypothetical protein
MRSFKSLTALAGAALVIGAGAGTAFAAAEDTQSGVWEHHQATTSYFTMTTAFTCPGLEHTVKQVLLYLGARPDVQVSASCPDPVAPVKTAVVKTDFYSLQPASSGASETINGQWVPIKLTPQSPSQAPFLGTSECELVYQFKDLFTKAFSYRDLKYDALCFPHQVTLLDYSVRGQVLKAETPLKAEAHQ